MSTFCKNEWFANTQPDVSIQIISIAFLAVYVTVLFMIMNNVCKYLILQDKYKKIIPLTFYILATLTVLIRGSEMLQFAFGSNDKQVTVTDANYICKCLLFAIGFFQLISMYEISHNIKNTIEAQKLLNAKDQRVH